ncbi:MarR family winged helix-turn-helix transcriptional regulator [Actinomadura montaniterrae]|uniref:MarR family transcriptional regulator n=1 Tax=Actinomadura montaniterrae TaxID=1803903 RepID=A0A6L3W2K2_9ACTN|nr:MarR family transcriptional regulator [Actinomadura montaniterrae]KAB2388441.1 MarR family transcriptional regulator [Actinomadura montaniterrae]
MLPRPPEVRRQWTARFPDMDASAMQIAELVKRIGAQLETAIEPLYDDAPLTAPELDLLIPLRHMEQPVIARRIAEHRHMSRAGVSKALAKLERRGFIERVPSPADRRASLVSITEAGGAAVDALFPRQVGIESRLVAGLGADRERVVEALTLLADAFERAAAELPSSPEHVEPEAPAAEAPAAEAPGTEAPGTEVPGTEVPAGGVG